MPSSAAIQRALNGTAVPSLKPSYSDSAILTAHAAQTQGQVVTGPSKLRVVVPAADFKETPRWPISPRLRSPPPVKNGRGQDDLPSFTAASLRLEGSTSTSSGDGEEDTPTQATAPELAKPRDKEAIRSPTWGPSTSSTTLETVQEISQPTTPAPGQVDGTAEEQNPIDLAVLSKDHNSKTKAADKADSGSESGEKKGEVKLKPTASGILRPTLPTLRPAASGTFKKPTEGSSAKNMTVETETVSSVPQVAVGGGGTINGSIRAKPSSETIRPKKEKTKTRRKAPSVAATGGETSHFPTSNGRRRSKSRLHDHPIISSSVYPREVLPSRKSSTSYLRELRGQSSAETLRGRESSESSRPGTSHAHSYASSIASYQSGCSFYSPYAPPAGNVPAYQDGDISTGRKISSYVRNILTSQPTASSKADIFEAKIASAVDEANSSDSEETFVYESNPPDHERPRRYHSRTPSATSMASAIEQRGGSRSLHPGMDGGNGMHSSTVGGHSVAMKKSMKFANYSSQPIDSSAPDDAANNLGTGRGTIRHHHIGRWGRGGVNGNGHPSLFDNESPFPNAKNKFGGTNSRQSSRPPSPRVGGGKFNRRLVGPYDDELGADDERTPLVTSSIRSNRSRHNRRRYPRQSQGFLARFAGCLVLSIMVLIVLSGAIGFLFATTQPLLEVRVTGLKKVLASEGELMFEVEIAARNPNILGVTVECAQLSVHAKSKYATGDDSWWSDILPSQSQMRRRGARIPQPEPQRRQRWGRVVGEVDDDGVVALDDSPLDPFPNPPIDTQPPPDDRPLLLLGHITAFDNPLYFEGSPFRHIHTYAAGEIRIGNPGNGTEDGNQRWKEVVRHEWELVVQGLVRYELPLQWGKKGWRSAQIGGRVSVEGGGGSGGGGGKEKGAKG